MRQAANGETTVQDKTTYDHARNCNAGQVFTDREGNRRAYERKARR